MFGYQKVGGLTFIRIGSLSMSFCVTRKPNRNPVQVTQLQQERLTIAALASVIALAYISVAIATFPGF